MLGRHRITNIFFLVRDIDRTEAFWRDCVGLDVQRMGDDGSGHDWLMAPTAGGLELIFFHGEPQPGNSPILVFDLPEGGIDGLLDGLLSRGAALVTPVSHAPGGWSAEWADPDGHVLSMYQAAEVPR